MEEVPPRLTDPVDMAALAEKYREFAPNVTFVDTLGAAAAGLNLSAIEVGTSIGVNFRAFVRDLKTDGVLVHHEGKDDERGAIGSIYLTNDTDAELRLRHDHEQEVLAVIVEKSRWGERFRTVNFGTRKVPGLHVEGWNEPAEFVAVYELSAGDPKRTVRVARSNAQAKAQRDAQQEIVFIEDTLREAGARDPNSGLKGIDLALRLAGHPEEGESDALHQKRVNAWADKLKNRAKRDPAYARLFAMVTEGDVPRDVRRWFAPLAVPVVAAEAGVGPW